MAIKPIFEQVDLLKRDLVNLSVDDLKAEMANDPELLLLDIREIQEQVDLGTIPGAIHVPRGMLEFWADPKSPYYRDYFTEDKRVVVFCAGGGRSAFAAQSLKDMGYSNVDHLEVGFNGWAKAGEPVQETASTSRWMRKPKETPPPVWVGHALLRVPDPAATKAFLLTIGARDAEPESSTPILELRGGTHIVVLQSDEPVADGAVAPFDLMVEDVDAMHAHCAAAGFDPGDIQQNPVHRFFELSEPGGHAITINSSHVAGVV